MKVAALQMVSTPDVEHNLGVALRLMAQAAAEGAELVALPEYFCVMGRHERDKLDVAEAFNPSPRTQGGTPLQCVLAQAAQDLGLWVVGGTVPLTSPQEGRVFNTTLVYAPDGTLAARYDKIHLFCFDDGHQSHDEARTLLAGDQPCAFTLTDRSGAAWRIGLGICYDLRFPELFRQLGEAEPLDLIVLPAAFTHTTGQAHWNLLLRARAVENLCHVLAVGQGGQHPHGRRTFGHSQIIQPWGEVQNSLPEGEGVVMGVLSRDDQTLRRKQLPALQHRVLR